MKVLTIEGKSQYDPVIDKRFQPSACGPLTAFILLEHHFPSSCPYSVNSLYKLLGGTRIGLFTWRFVYNMQKSLGQDWIVERCKIDEVKRQIDEGRPVAAKFDKWSNFRWRGKFEFDYHWVPVIGYEEKNDDFFLILHDNGGRNRMSQVRRVSYNKNKAILSFVKVELDGVYTKQPL